MSLIKKHKIKIFSEDYSSDFVVDLRSNLKFNKEDQKKDDKIIEIKNIKQNENIINNNFLLSNLKSVPKNNIAIPIKFNKNKFKKTFFYPVYYLVFKILKSIFFFFFDWIKDIFKFFKFKPKFKKIKLRIRIPFLNFKIKKININFRFFTKKTKKEPIINLDYLKTKQLKLFKTKKEKKNKLKSILFFFLFLLLVVIIFKFINYYSLYKKNTLKDNLLDYSMSGITNLVNASEAISVLDFYKSYENFSQAESDFKNVEEELKKVDELLIFLSSFSKDDKFRLFSQSKKISSLAKHLASFGNNLSLSFNSLLLFFSDDKSEDNFYNFSFYIKKSFSDLKKINFYISKINESTIPSEHLENFIFLKNTFKSFESDFSNFLNSIDAWRDFLAVDSDKRYLLVFQNNTEIRASGGFIGSYALVDVKNGKIVKVEVPPGGSYDTEGGMKTSVEPPKPLHLIRNSWYFWDANWWPDWKMSAQNLMWFYEKSGGPSVDGVISFTPEVLSDLLYILGPVDLSEKYGIIIDNDNFHNIIQEIVETIGNPELYESEDLLIKNYLDLDNFEKNKPKEVIGDLFDVLLSRLMEDISVDKLLKISDLLLNNLNKKNILLYFENNELQEFCENYSWAGRVKNTNCDYLMIVDTNIAGGKSDRFLIKNYSLSSELRVDGSVVNKLKIERDREDEIGYPFSGQRNVNWLRIYVPLGSKLVSSSGFSTVDDKFFKNSVNNLEDNEFLSLNENISEIDLASGLRIYQENNKTVFANWTMTDLGKKSIIEIEYELPYNIHKSEDSFKLKNIFFRKNDFTNYCLLWQKQAGALNSSINYSFKNKSQLNVFWFYPENSELENSAFIYQDFLNFDKYFNFLLK